MNYGLFQGTNQWWAVIENLKSKRDLAYMSAGMLRLISNRFKAANTWLPMSQKVRCLLLRWSTVLVVTVCGFTICQTLSVIFKCHHSLVRCRPARWYGPQGI